MKKVFIATIILTICSSCIVSKKKYDDLLAQKVKMEGDLSDRSTQLDKANTDLSDREENLKKIKEDTTNLGIDVRASRKKLAELEKEHAQLDTYYKNLMSSSGKLNRDMVKQEEQLLSIQQNLDKTRLLN